ncbi:MAG: hypothetical protein HOM14_11900 [Gammaproteobacteria bacterium]|jgi:hypothetical protein|nr:hypothetical protein [Gammaproteobacteria bacterium]MBT3723786.1 hypothetical protein [Gammaproteobacteria bacterium]MBT4075012.1 hypothetical protein [Gammaproteobacteria bacterium]MBT4196420.1 hypothetical protein [Gammaproteobacteria bacterium]MBT4448159.1 hypothetical protein [Gammaproteobacteria bacterium]
MQTLFCLLILLIVSILPVQADENGRWKLTISGTDKIEFGTEKLAGGLNVQWKTVLEFKVENNRFLLGTGTAELVEEITTFSRPANMFDCQLVNGIFANRTGMSFSMPHLRYKAFPVAGKLLGKNIQLKPFLDYPGNYFAVLYRCETTNELGSFWLERSPRIAREMSKRQDTTTRFEAGIYQANIKEVKSIAPGPQLELPLIDGLSFSMSELYGLRLLEYSLNKMADE